MRPVSQIYDTSMLPDLGDIRFLLRNKYIRNMSCIGHFKNAKKYHSMETSMNHIKAIFDKILRSTQAESREFVSYGGVDVLTLDSAYRSN